MLLWLAHSKLAKKVDFLRRKSKKLQKLIFITTSRKKNLLVRVARWDFVFPPFGLFMSSGMSEREIFRWWIICLFNESNFLALMLLLIISAKIIYDFFFHLHSHCRDILRFVIYALWRWEWRGKIILRVAVTNFLIILPLIYELGKKRVPTNFQPRTVFCKFRFFER